MDGFRVLIQVLFRWNWINQGNSLLVYITFYCYNSRRFIRANLPAICEYLDEFQNDLWQLLSTT